MRKKILRRHSDKVEGGYNENPRHFGGLDVRHYLGKVKGFPGLPDLLFIGEERGTSEYQAHPT